MVVVYLSPVPWRSIAQRPHFFANYYLNSGIERFIDQFFRCCKISGLSFNWLQKLYIGKNCLNKFRQDNGYKEGTYVKVWNGDEDNVVMVSILEQMENVSFDELYNKLEEAYKAAK